MAQTVKVRLQFGAVEGDAGDEVEVSKARAKILVKGGAAHYVTKDDARTAGGDPETETKKAADAANKGTATGSANPAKQ